MKALLFPVNIILGLLVAVYSTLLFPLYCLIFTSIHMLTGIPAFVKTWRQLLGLSKHPFLRVVVHLKMILSAPCGFVINVALIPLIFATSIIVSFFGGFYAGYKHQFKTWNLGMIAQVKTMPKVLFPAKRFEKQENGSSNEDEL